jgi:hypothetical protein
MPSNITIKQGDHNILGSCNFCHDAIFLDEVIEVSGNCISVRFCRSCKQELLDKLQDTKEDKNER